ncbi:MAG: glutamate 5-kinase [Candidatus Latescibacterota bacterium]|nr:glutamate 5-kinase [Candidatus Latescibacterota bacterium]
MTSTSLVRRQIQNVRRLVVKVGSNVLTTGEQKPNTSVIKQLVQDVIELRARGCEVAIVTSGAVAIGMGRLGLKRRPETISELQALAAVGQSLLMNFYERLFREEGVPIGQVLLTAEDILGGRHRYVNLENTFSSLFGLGAVPIINENDSVSVDELKRQLGENDMLAAYVTNLIKAELLIIMSDIEGLYSGFDAEGPKGDLIREVKDGDFELDSMVGENSSVIGRGGMQTKLQAAKLLMTCGEMTIIAHGRKHRLTRLMDGVSDGTLFLPSGRRLGSRERWIAFASPERGELTVSAVAQHSLLQEFGSLYPIEIISCEGDFSAGDVVRIFSKSGNEIGRGVIQYDFSELCPILGKNLSEIKDIYDRTNVEVIHKDDLVLL